MKKQILYVTAFDEHGIFVKANDAEKTSKYFCPVCKSELILKKSGKVGKGSKRPHFAHYHLTENCTPESALHYSFKKMLYEKIKNNINNKSTMIMVWECNYCHSEHEGNLLKKVFDVKDEYNMKICKPDIALFDDKGNVFAVIEIVVTHKPEENVVKYYNENNIILIQIELESEDDLDNIDVKLKTPSTVDCCLNPRCKNCGRYKIKKELIIVDNECYNCENLMKVCYIKNSNDYKYPRDFNENEINLAKSKGVLLEMRFSKTRNEKYLANVCPRCKAFVGDWYMYDEIISEVEYKHNENIQKYDLGYYCDICKE